MLVEMGASPDIIACPRQFRIEALALALRDLAPSQRLDVAGPALSAGDATSTAYDGLFVACREGTLQGAVWAQQQPGNTAVLWPPQLKSGENQTTAKLLAGRAARFLDSAGIAMSQVLLQSHDEPVAPLLIAAGYCYLADLVYLTCEAERFPTDLLESQGLEFLPYNASQRDRFMHVIERTYEETLDCPALNGARRMEEVLEGYQATGTFRPEHWLIVRAGGRDVGVLLLADHPAARHWELVYMGLVPSFRGQGMGRQITQHAQLLARRENVQRIVLAVDAANSPALALYRAAGFEPWDRRVVFVRFLQMN